MNVNEARRIWGSDVPQDVLEEWIRIYNLRQKTFANDDPRIPKGATIELDPDEFHSVTAYEGHDVRHDRVRDPSEAPARR